MTHEINMNNHQQVEEKKKNGMSFKASTIDDEEEKSENGKLDLITKKFMKYIKFEKIKGRRSQSKMSPQVLKIKAMVAT